MREEGRAPGAAAARRVGCGWRVERGAQLDAVCCCGAARAEMYSAWARRVRAGSVRRQCRPPGTYASGRDTRGLADSPTARARAGGRARWVDVACVYENSILLRERRHLALYVKRARAYPARMGRWRINADSPHGSRPRLATVHRRLGDAMGDAHGSVRLTMTLTADWHRDRVRTPDGTVHTHGPRCDHVTASENPRINLQSSHHHRPMINN